MTMQAWPDVVPVGVEEERAWLGLEELREGLRGQLVRSCKDEHDLDDTIQETFLRAARYRRHSPVANLRPWVTRIARNVLADGRRRQARAGFTAREEEPLDVAVDEPDPGAEGMSIGGRWFEREDARALVRRALTRLRTQEHALLQAFYAGRRDVAQTSRATGIPRQLIKVRLYRARRKLRELLRREAQQCAHVELAS